MLNRYLKHLLTGLSLVYLSSCKDKNAEIDPVEVSPSAALNTYPASLATDWQDLSLQLIKSTNGYVPPVAARALAYINLGLYESTVYGTANKSLAGQLTHIETLPIPDIKLEYNWGLAGNAATYYLVKNLFSGTSIANFQKIETLRATYEVSLKSSGSTETIERSVKYGTEVAEAVWNYSKTDNGHEAFKNVFPTYALPEGLGIWKPVGTQKALLPYWSRNTSFIKGNSTTDPPKPIPFSYNSSSAFFKEAREVYDMSKKLTAEQRAIALFFADGAGSVTPPGHHMNVATEVLKLKESSLSVASETYVKMGLAINDAFIACWRCKYRFNTIRPITYIRETIDNNWTPIVGTPPFPEYTSGHSSGAGAAAEILKAQFGENTTFIDNTYAGVYPNRSYSNFTAYADETSNSRLYGGIHFRQGCEEGVRNGRQIAKNVLSLEFK
ncbi:MAG: vanadium-dependent haloperoxidase [Spirosomataceae bacterium]